MLPGARQGRWRRDAGSVRRRSRRRRWSCDDSGCHRTAGRPGRRQNRRVVPEHGLAVLGEARLDLDDGGRPEGVIEEFLLPAPAHLHGLAGRLGQPGRLDRLLAAALAAESAPDEGGDHPHVVRGQAQSAGDLVPSSGKGSGWIPRPWPSLPSTWARAVWVSIAAWAL